MRWLFFVLCWVVIISLIAYTVRRIHQTEVLPRLINSSRRRKILALFLWIAPFASFALGILGRWFDLIGLFTISVSLFFALLLSVLLLSCVLFLEDIYRFFRYIHQKGKKWMRAQRATKDQSNTDALYDAPIARSAFLMKSALLLSAAPYISVGYGVLCAAYDYQIHRASIDLPNLPSAWHGLRIAQISDIHAGSFWQKKPLQVGIEMLLSEQPDLIFFTGDIVNSMTDEMKPYVSLFAQLRAPLGVFSVLGNHDYGDYHRWSSKQAKRANLRAMHQLHKTLGWQLLLNEHKHLKIDNEPIAIIGVENWGRGSFSKYGDLAAAVKGIEASTSLLLSHDPSHWEAEVQQIKPQIDLTCSGHTHGFQMGIEAKGLRWSPAQYIYKQWAGLYQRHHQYLYVNRGFGFIGFPGRMGILPEITLLELRKKNT